MFVVGGIMRQYSVASNAACWIALLKLFRKVPRSAFVAGSNMQVSSCRGAPKDHAVAAAASSSSSTLLECYALYPALHLNPLHQNLRRSVGKSWPMEMPPRDPQFSFDPFRLVLPLHTLVDRSFPLWIHPRRVAKN